MRNTISKHGTLKFSATLLLGVLAAGCGSISNGVRGTGSKATGTATGTVASISLTPSTVQVRAGASAQFTVVQTGNTASAGSWAVTGGDANGSITSSGLYTAPATLPNGAVQVTYQASAGTATASITVLNPLPTLSTANPATLNAISDVITVTGTGFVPGSTFLVNGNATATQYIDSSHLTGSIAASGTAVVLQVQNPDPGGAVSNSLALAYSPGPMTVSPASLTTGPVTLSVTMPGIGPGSVVSLAGTNLTTTSIVGDVITATGNLLPWTTGTVLVSVTATDGTTVLAQANEPITPTAVTFDAAARFSTQAAWGPRPDVVLHIQQVGLSAFVDEQLSEPVGSYNVYTTNPIRSFFTNITSGESLLRLRMAWAFQTFMPGQTYFSNHNFALPWEQTLERDAFANYRQILLDAASDPNIGTLLNLPGNVASNDPNVHPNQNFARELMQLFSMGPVLLNEDGTPQLDANGNTIPAYDENTVNDLARVLTGWNYATPQYSDMFNAGGIDFSETLVANESQHDEGTKTLFGSVTIPAGQTAEQDRDAAIDAIINHPNTAPFVSKLLIQRLVKSQPSPAYVKRIAEVFKNDGNGITGNLAAVVKAILLDPEARAGDTTPQASDGFLQDPLYQQMFFMSVLQISGEDDQSTYWLNDLSENFWNPGTVFSYFSPTYTVPGTNIISPEFQLLTNFTDVQRQQFLWSVVTGQQPGFNNGFGGWLYDNFTTLPAMVDALNHLLYHGGMPQAEQAAILDYCSGISDHQLQMESAVFLALNSNSYLVSQ